MNKLSGKRKRFLPKKFDDHELDTPNIHTLSTRCKLLKRKIFGVNKSCIFTNKNVDFSLDELKREFAFMKIDVVEYHEQLNALTVRLLEMNNFDKEKSIFDFRRLLWTFKIIAWSDIQLHRSADTIDIP
ncbi:hypothetical protein A3Q56_07167 [Intoshia linei]|uniref:Uncharacterized protein n=1 Tax=Intoshia linei TaxID=1819745 RepID=A0A177ASZ5_9BILA|nr:hypothetical protein A3Q56_07167 [Intoshia linei]